MEKNLDYQVVLGLKKDLSILQSKMAKALESDNVGTYINLQKALVNSLNAIKELSNEYKLMYSEYYLDGDKKDKQVAVWEQNSNGDVRNHKVWDTKPSFRRDFDKLKGEIYNISSCNDNYSVVSNDDNTFSISMNVNVDDYERGAILTGTAVDWSIRFK